MVVPCGVAAAKMASSAGSAGATALGFSMGKSDLDLTRECFELQMRQAKRLWTADWAEASVRHGEQCMQSAQQHADAQALATATYFQAERIASQSMKLTRDQDSRSYEMSWRAEVREALRDELANQNNRFNIIMLCDTVCLSCVFGLVADGSPPTDVSLSLILLNLYVFSLGLSIMLFTVSLWCSVIVVRRLHEHTASILESKLFAQSQELQKIWQHQLGKSLPTGPYEMYLVHQAYDKWVAEYIDPIGKASISMLSVGVVAMFVTAGLLTHMRYLIEYTNATSAVSIFWSTVFITSTTVVVMKISEDRKEKKKVGVYDVSWQDRSTVDTGPFAKISRAAEELFSTNAVELASTERMTSLSTHEQIEREFCPNTKSLHHQVKSFQKESEQRGKTRKDILQLLMTAAEELDALPEELTSRLNKVLHDIDESDGRTSTLVSMPSGESSMLSRDGSRADWTRLRRMPPTRRKPMTPYPIDVQGIPVSLVSLRKKLGEVSLTTLLRLKNLSDEPLRLKSGVQLKDGKYIKSLTVNGGSDPSSSSSQGNSSSSKSVCHYLYPGTEIPPRTEVVIAARSGGGWVPTSGIAGTLIYTNRDESWIFEINFCNALLRNIRNCHVQVSHVVSSCNNSGGPSSSLRGVGDSSYFSKGDDNKNNDAVAASDEYWQISKYEIDRKANNEVAISFDVLRGEQATKAAVDHHRSQISLKAGFLVKKGFGLKWQQKWVILTPTELIYSVSPNNIQHEGNNNQQPRKTIPIKDIRSIRQVTDVVKKYVFEIYTNLEGGGTTGLYRFSAPSQVDCEDWIQQILNQMNNINNGKDLEACLIGGTSEESDANSLKETSIECVQSGMVTEVLPI